MTKSTKSRVNPRAVSTSTVKKSVAAIAPQWAFTKVLQGVRLSLAGAGLDTVFREDAFHGISADLMAQVQGAEVALAAARRFGRKFMARCGYLHSAIMDGMHGEDSAESRKARALERHVFTGADRVVVTTDAIKDTVMKRYGVPGEGITVIPNYVQTDGFRPEPRTRPSGRRICYVGRLEKEKNLFGLWRAMKGLDAELVVAGSGSLLAELRRDAEENNLAVQFLGTVPHERLPNILNASDVFVLPSFYEGHPKALLEAMACALPVIGTRVAGIRELIRHGETGYLCETTPEAIRSAIEELLGDPTARTKMGKNARSFVVERFSLDRIASMELEVLEALLST